MSLIEAKFQRELTIRVIRIVMHLDDRFRDRQVSRFLRRRLGLLASRRGRRRRLVRHHGGSGDRRAR